MRSVLMLLCLLFASTAEAQQLELPQWVQDIGVEKPPAFLLGEDKIVHIAAGDKAPWEGILLDLPTASRWTLRTDWAQKQLSLDADTLRAVLRSEVEARLALLNKSEESYKREIQGLRSDLRDQAKVFATQKNPPFYKTGKFGFAMGIVICGAIAVATTVALR